MALCPCYIPVTSDPTAAREEAEKASSPTSCFTWASGLQGVLLVPLYTFSLSPQPLGVRSPGRTGAGARDARLAALPRHLSCTGFPEAPTATCPASAAKYPHLYELPHTCPLSPDGPRCVFIPVKVPGIPFHDHKRASVLLAPPCSLIHAPRILSSSTVNMATRGVSGPQPARREEPL